MNQWNKTRRLSRAYLDDENDPILEMDLLANTGMTPKQITEWVSVFISPAVEFRQHTGQLRVSCLPGNAHPKTGDGGGRAATGVIIWGSLSAKAHRRAAPAVHHDVRLERTRARKVFVTIRII